MMRALLAILLLLAGLGAARADFSRAALEAIAAEPSRTRNCRSRRSSKTRMARRAP